jgi:hypothetical protein
MAGDLIETLPRRFNSSRKPRDSADELGTLVAQGPTENGWGAEGGLDMPLQVVSRKSVDTEMLGKTLDVSSKRVTLCASMVSLGAVRRC